MDNLWIKNLRKVEPYVPGEQSKDKDIVKLNANENPYPPSPEVIKAINDFDCNTLKLYPDANAAEFKAAIAEFYNVKKGKRVYWKRLRRCACTFFPVIFQQRKTYCLP